MFSNLQTRLMPWGIGFAILIVYVIAFFLLYHQFGEGTAALAILPVTLIAWIGGAKSGVFAGVLSFPLNTLLLNLTEPRSSPFAVVIQSGGGPGSLAIMLIGFVIGLIHDQRAQMAQELADRQRVENALIESEQRHLSLLESSQRQAQELALLDQVRQVLAHELELPLIFRTVVEGIAKTFGYTQVSLYLIDGDSLILQHQVGYDRVIERIPLTQGVIGRVVRSQQPVLLEDVRDDPAFLGAIEGIISEVCVPLFDRGEVVGVLNVESTHGVRLSEADLHLMTALGEQIGIALGRAHLYSEIRESEERFKLIAWATADAVWDWDVQKNQVWWGGGLQKIFHYVTETEQTDYEWWHDHIHPEDKYKVDHSLNQALELGMEFWSKEYRFQRSDRTYADIMDRAYIIRDEAGKAERVIGAMMDITERKQAEATIRHQNEMLSSLYHITLNLLRYREVNQLLKALVEFSTAFLDAAYAEIMLIDGETLVVKAATQNQHHLIGERVERMDALLSWQAFDTHEPAVLSDYTNWPHRRNVYDKIPLHAVADFPILIDEQCLGVLAVGRDKPEYEFTLDQIQFGRFFANLTALVLNNAQLREALHEQSIRDPLTGLYNRRYMAEALKQHLSRVNRQEHLLGIIMIDIDYFKRFNDTHGHLVGDALLHELGQFIQRNIRSEDIACRYGGEEFILIMPDISLAAAQQRAEYLQQEVRKLQVQEAGQSFEGITLSLGVAVYPLHGDTLDTVLRAADSALYHAKHEGRDRVVMAEKED